jgi:hypothetical protein
MEPGKPRAAVGRSEAFNPIRVLRPDPGTKAQPGPERQGAAQDAGRAAGFENAAAGITGVFFAVALSAVKSAVGSPEIRRIGTV